MRKPSKSFGLNFELEAVRVYFNEQRLGKSAGGIRAAQDIHGSFSIDFRAGNNVLH
jgi:hypothetical protein